MLSNYDQKIYVTKAQQQEKIRSKTLNTEELVKLNKKIDSEKIEHEAKMQELTKMIDNTKKIKEFHETLAYEKFASTNSHRNNNGKKATSKMQEEQNKLKELEDEKFSPQVIGTNNINLKDSLDIPNPDGKDRKKSLLRKSPEEIQNKLKEVNNLLGKERNSAVIKNTYRNSKMISVEELKKFQEMNENNFKKKIEKKVNNEKKKKGR